jgi:general secretion pathway protein G
MHAIVDPARPPRRRRLLPGPSVAGFTLVEIALVVAIIATLAAIGIPTYVGYVEKARVIRCIAEIEGLSTSVDLYEQEKGALPDTLPDAGQPVLDDPWGNPYEYLPVTAVGKARKDKFLVPLNSDYDLYSVGKDGKSAPPLTAQASRDDVVRANDGAYIGLAANY